jgi:hypothetical protein
MTKTPVPVFPYLQCPYPRCNEGATSGGMRCGGSAALAWRDRDGNLMFHFASAPAHEAIILIERARQLNNDIRRNFSMGYFPQITRSNRASKRVRLIDIDHDVVNGVTHSHHDLGLVDRMFHAKVTSLPRALKRARSGKRGDPRAVPSEELECLFLADEYHYVNHASTVYPSSAFLHQDAQMP